MSIMCVHVYVHMKNLSYGLNLLCRWCVCRSSTHNCTQHSHAHVHTYTCVYIPLRKMESKSVVPDKHYNIIA